MRAAQIAVDDADPVELANADNGPLDLIVVIPGALTSEAYLGPSDVTAATGALLAADGVRQRIRLGHKESLWAICAASESTTVHVLEVSL